MPILMAVDYTIQICEAVASAHALGIIHRDLKPSNFFVTPSSDGSAVVKVLDFGISKAAEQEGIPDPRLTETQAVFGSPTYMSPEQIRSSKNVDPRSDVWSLGVAMFEMLTGKLPFVADNVPGLLASVIAAAPRANDKSVSVGVFTSEGIRTASASGCADSGPSPDSPGFFTPGWCGDDTWTVTDSTVDTPDRRRFLPKARGVGHVTNYQFVVNLESSAEIPFGGYKLSVSSTVAQGRLVPIDANGKPIDTTTPPDPSIIKRWSIEDALLGGRIPVGELVAAMGTANIPGADAGGGNIPAICSSPTLFPLIKQQICDAIDISASPRLDFEKGVACDALSIAIAMTGDQAITGELLPPEDGGANDCFPIADGGGPQRGPPGTTYRCE